VYRKLAPCDYWTGFCSVTMLWGTYHKIVTSPGCMVPGNDLRRFRGKVVCAYCCSYFICGVGCCEAFGTRLSIFLTKTYRRLLITWNSPLLLSYKILSPLLSLCFSLGFAPSYYFPYSTLVYLILEGLTVY
jgi:hypothetical protein